MYEALQEFTKKSQEFTTSVIDFNTQAALFGIDLMKKSVGSESTTYLKMVSESIESISKNAKKVVTGDFFPLYSGNKS
jgi:hypothetical protein|tara:strand:- start:1744 stop:1977 length:234 start_codon:yes stop_codon:yes gene_type:complete